MIILSRMRDSLISMSFIKSHGIPGWAIIGVDISRDWERKCKREDGGRGVGGDMAVSWG